MINHERNFIPIVKSLLMICQVFGLFISQWQKYGKRFELRGSSYEVWIKKYKNVIQVLLHPTFPLSNSKN